MTAPEPAPAAPPATSLELRDFRLRAGERTLLEQAHAQFPAGQIILIVGPSGAGKSLLLRTLAGLLSAQEKEVSVEGVVADADGPRPAAEYRPRSTGVVFQSFALFDELSPLENVQFAAAHRRTTDGAPPAPRELLQELRVPLRVRTASLSGGQRQRLAIARTLAFAPRIVLYDEPTSGLDPATAAQVAGLIAQTHAAHQRTSLIVTHDYEALCAIADRVYVFDPVRKALCAVQPRDPAAVRRAWPPAVVLEPPLEEPPPAQRVREAALRAIRRAGDVLAGSSRALEHVLQLPWRLIPRWRSPRWGLQFGLHYLRLVADPSAWLYMVLAGAIIGFVATYFTFRFLPFRAYTEPLVIEDLLIALGFSLYRILVPIIGTILIAARCGAAVASDVGGKSYGRQLDALRSLGAAPQKYVLTNVLWAFLLGTPLLIAIAFFTARLASLLVFATTHPDYGPYFWEANFHRELIVPGRWLYKGSWWLLAKLLACGLGTALIAYYRSVRPKYSSKDVSDGITSTILWATLHVLAMHYLFAFFEFPKKP